MSLPYKLGSSGPEVTAWQKWFNKAYSSYAPAVDGYYGNADAEATKVYQRRTGLPITGQWDEHTAAKAGFPRISQPAERRKIWIYTAPGSGGNWNQGPSYEMGEWAAKVLKINHQPIGYPMGGYLGFMGGDPAFSYNDVIGFQGAELEKLLTSNPDINDPSLELWFSGYSQSADGMEDALVRLFGDGAKFAHLRNRINGVIQFGNPSKDKTGIARKQRPRWLLDLVRNVTRTGDFYAEAPDEIRPAFYAIIIQAEMELPFFVHVLKVAVPVILGYLPLLGMFGPLAQVAVAAMTGLNGLLPLLGGLMGQASAADEEVDRKLVEMLSVTGLLKNIPGLIQLVGALPGLQAHGDYFSPQPEFGGRTGIQVGCDIMAQFRR